MTWVGALTALFAATIAVAQYDIKKVLAYSTISQLGFMVAAVGMGAAWRHLPPGDACLFQGAALPRRRLGHPGHGKGAGRPRARRTKRCDIGAGRSRCDFDPQDMRNMGGLRDRMPVTFWVYLIGALALAGHSPAGRLLLEG